MYVNTTKDVNYKIDKKNAAPRLRLTEALVSSWPLSNVVGILELASNADTIRTSSALHTKVCRLWYRTARREAVPLPVLRQLEVRG